MTLYCKGGFYYHLMRLLKVNSKIVRAIVSSKHISNKFNSDVKGRI